MTGLYRYFMNDLVEVTGFFQKTPLLRFVQKGKGVTNLTGEKLYEAQVIDAVQGELPRCGVTPTFFVMVADDQAMAYRLMVEVQTDCRRRVPSAEPSIDAASRTQHRISSQA